MSEESTKSVPHPDDLIVIGIYFAFQAKLNPDNDDPPPLYAPEIELHTADASLSRSQAWNIRPMGR